MARRKAQVPTFPKKSTSAAQAGKERRTASQSAGPAKSSTNGPAQPIQVSGRWLLSAIGATLAAAVLCAWGVLCLLFWQGSWQLLYHPVSTITRTPAAAGLSFEPIGFATTGSGLPQLSGWWIPAAADAPFSRYTVLFLHGQDGNLSNTVDHLAQLHKAGVNVFVFDYRGYGQSQFVHPSERLWLEDAGSALHYLTATRHISPSVLVLDGSSLGANLALEFAAVHPELAGVVVESPLRDATGVIFHDDRARLVPARLLVHDRYDPHIPAAKLHIPSLWFLQAGDQALDAKILQSVPARKMVIWMPSNPGTASSFSDELSRWLGDLRAH
ncbi:MAG TPA: alpha/beta fold hydrolase [Terracidiphilus sp.]|nr:alpha/beta fold hydrolase [Terracidiphilus sp.]